MTDPIVLSKLSQLGFTPETHPDIYMRCEAMTLSERWLDKPPARLVFKRQEETPIFGCKQEFIVTYQQLKNEVNDGVFTLDFGKVKRLVDKEVFLVLQALIRQCVSGIPERREACFLYFKTIGTTPGDVLTKQRVADAIYQLKPQEYYEKELLSAINFCLSGGNTAVLYWTSICEFTGIYEDAYKDGQKVIEEKCKTEADVNKFVKEYYAAYRKDEEFKKQCFTRGVSRPLIAMVYYFYQNQKTEV